LQTTPSDVRAGDKSLLYFWAFGDLHYRARLKWRAIHEPRLAPMFQDIHTLWQVEGPPDFAVSPGDIVHAGSPENYALVRNDLAAQLEGVPFYPGIGNHEYHRERAEDRLHTAADFLEAWGKPTRYYWMAGGGRVCCIMLDHPDPYLQNPQQESQSVVFSQETLAFLDATLAGCSAFPAVIFAHCPLRDTVLDRDARYHLDNHSEDPSFSVENSQAVRTILGQHPNAVLYISGHTHSGWGSPGLVSSEILEGHSITHVNLMSPWFTGRRNGPRRIEGPEKFTYIADSPDTLASFAVHIYEEYATLQVRDHLTHTWLARWRIPFQRRMKAAQCRPWFSHYKHRCIFSIT
jgi:hypothetical protein